MVIFLLVMLVSQIFQIHCTSDRDWRFMHVLLRKLDNINKLENQFVVGYVKKANTKLIREIDFNITETSQFQIDKTLQHGWISYFPNNGVNCDTKLINEMKKMINSIVGEEGNLTSICLLGNALAANRILIKSLQVLKVIASAQWIVVLEN